MKAVMGKLEKNIVKSFRHPHIFLKRSSLTHLHCDLPFVGPYSLDINAYN